MTRVLFAGLFISLFLCCSEHRPTVLSGDNGSLNLLFYNVENLFDTQDDPRTADEEFTPAGKKMWTEERYQNKLLNLGKVIASANDCMPDIIGLCEVENRKVLGDLIASPHFEKTNYSILHQDSPDGRGIDVALIYDPSRIQLEEAGYIQSTLPSGDRPNTRLILHARGTFNGSPFHVFVNHWPSRYGGQEKSEPNRLTVAYNLRQAINAVMSAEPDAQIVLMGDFNDYPNNKSLTDVLSAGRKGEKLLTNLMWEQHKRGEGSYYYRGEWGALDQFIVSQNLLDGEGAEVDQSSVIFVRHEWMMYTDSTGVAFPNRTYGGPNYYGGFSDHLPIFMTIRH